MAKTNLTKMTSGVKAAGGITNVDKMTSFVEDPEIKKIMIKKGMTVADLFDPPVVKFPGTVVNPNIPLPTFPPVGLPPPTIPFPPVPPAPPVEQSQTSFEIDTRLQLLISSIPIANPGNIITSEYHNALRDAVRALASRLGLSVNPTAEFKILTFAPNFLPTLTKDAKGVNLKWDVTLNRAVVPEISDNDVEKPVSGGFFVQLPDNSNIFQMIVRGNRLGKTEKNPKVFEVVLNRMKFGKDAKPQPLISIDLKEVKDGTFEEDEVAKLSDQDMVSINSNPLIANATLAERKTVNNEEWMYFVTADWLAGEKNAAKFEINSIQIICNA